MLTLVLIGCDKPPPAPPPPRPALVMVVGDKTVAPTMALVGEVLPRYESNQGFRINGKIIERKVEVGSRVNKGQILARLDAADARLAAAASLADVKSAEANLSLAKAELKRYRQLYDRKFVSASSLDVKEAELKTTAAKLAQLQAQANVSGNQTRYTDLTADRDGIVTMIRAEPGQVVETGEVIAKIADTQKIDVLVAVPESHMSGITLNASVRIRLWANRQQIYQGTVREISPSAESATRVFNVRITINNPDTTLKFGMTASVSFSNEVNQTATTMLIPSSALTEINGKKTVWVIDANNTVKSREVSAGEFSEAGILVTSGLEAGEKIAIAGVHTLVAGQQVKPVIESEQ